MANLTVLPAVSSPRHVNQKMVDTPGDRIPVTLQAVFLASNRGKEVNQAPPEDVAAKDFLRTWGKGVKKFFRRNNNNSKTTTTMTQQQQQQQQQPEISKPMKVIQVTEVKTTANGQRRKKKVSPKAPPRVCLTPQQYLDSLVRSRGYSTETFSSLECAYYCQPSEWQQASYDAYLIQIVKQGDVDKLYRIMTSGAVSPNPCNSYGESLLHTVCRLGNAEMLKVLLEDAKADIQVADDYGRTPMHDACWGTKPHWDTIQLILKYDGAHAFYMKDCRASLPLQYVTPENRAQYIEWLESKKDIFWPRRPKHLVGPPPPPSITIMAPDMKLPISIPEEYDSTMVLKLSKMVASGKIQPEEAAELLANNDNDEDSDDEDDGDSEEDDDDSDYDSDDSESLFDEDEVASILQVLKQ